MHSCSTLTVHCIDFRLQKTIKDYLDNQLLLGDCDILSVAGGVKDMNFVLSQVKLSKSLHSIKKVVLVNHTDCGAYGGSSAFANAEAEKMHHASELLKAKHEISRLFPDLTVETFLAVISTQGEVNLEMTK